MVKITVVNIKSPNESYPIEIDNNVDQELLIGREPDCTIQLNDLGVSRHHGKIIVAQGNCYFIDVRSTIGSWINNEKANVDQMYLLKVRDNINIAHCFTLIVLEDSKTAIDLPTNDPHQYMPLAFIERQKLQHWQKGDLTVRCLRVIQETSDVKTFCFVADPPVMFNYKPGQFVTLNLDINGEEVLRSYSISSSPSKPDTLEITVKRVPAPGANILPGKVSNWLHDHIQVGSEVNLTGPFGKFTCFNKPSPKLLFISAGSGITPMMSMSRWILDTGSGCDVVFCHSARSTEDIIFQKELELMAARYPNFRLKITITREKPGQLWLGLTGRLNLAMLEMMAADFRERNVYVCGPNPFMEEIKKMFISINFPMDNYYEESFGPPAQKTSAPPSDSGKNTNSFSERVLGISPNLDQQTDGTSDPPVIDKPPAIPPSKPLSTALVVVFSKSQKEFPADEEQSILELAEQEGVKIRSSCRSGGCGTCKKRKLEGEVKMGEFDRDVLEESEWNEGYILTCISYPKTRVVIEA
ncbi:2Fe-2S iron-sulfur cluster-binding protein [Gloeocapsa sp. PCC 73106]|uniref:FAD-binding oxidoreductase n=1 Tax=Gloeocapsa sp. PCC 73106 TaxID=102232 RepID=UPI0002AC84A1|nr:2Fe-2S iron-sulfur cluster-binding protein [Gloeocapsa sp. PCC 73106]ELR99259.1 flavodoxin reductase family protein [Gloeocapsa sp. PCC 73106]